MKNYSDSWDDDSIILVGKTSDDDWTSEDEFPIYILVILVLLFAMFLGGLIIYLSWRHERSMQRKRQGAKLTSSSANFLRLLIYHPPWLILFSLPIPQHNKPTGTECLATASSIRHELRMLPMLVLTPTRSAPHRLAIAPLLN